MVYHITLGALQHQRTRFVLQHENKKSFSYNANQINTHPQKQQLTFIWQRQGINPKLNNSTQYSSVSGLVIHLYFISSKLQSLIRQLHHKYNMLTPPNPLHEHLSCLVCSKPRCFIHRWNSNDGNCITEITTWSIWTNKQPRVLQNITGNHKGFKR